MYNCYLKLLNNLSSPPLSMQVQGFINKHINQMFVWVSRNPGRFYSNTGFLKATEPKAFSRILSLLQSYAS